MTINLGYGAEKPGQPKETKRIERVEDGLDEAMRPLKVLAHPVIVPQSRRLTETTRGAHLEPHVISPATAAPTPHVSPLTRMKSMLSWHNLHLTLGRWGDHYHVVTAQHDEPNRLRLHRVTHVLRVLEHKVNVLVETLEGPAQRLAPPHLDEDCLTKTTLEDPLNHLSQTDLPLNSPSGSNRISELPY